MSQADSVSSTGQPGAGETGSSNDGSTWKKAEAKFTTKRSSEFFDPCQEAAAKSIKCLHRNAGERDMCMDYFQAYRDCKKEWMNERKMAKRA